MELSLDDVVRDLDCLGLVKGEASIGLSVLRGRLGHLAVVPDDVANDLDPVSLVNHQTIDSIVVGLVMVQPHPPMGVCVMVSCHIDPWDFKLNGRYIETLFT